VSSRTSRFSLVAGLVLLLSACAPAQHTAAGTESPTTWPSSIAALGHSGLTGSYSDPDHPGEDAKNNSWATGTNPEVNSIYLRALAQSPALKGHEINTAVSGTNVDDLPDQVLRALSEERVPDLFIIQSVDNDMKCDGTDEANIPVYGDKMTAVLQSIVDGAPKAKVYVIGTPVTWQNYEDVIAGRPDLVAVNEGDGPCDPFDSTGKERPEALVSGQAITDAYGEALRASCAKFPACTFGGDEMRAMEVVDADIAPDGNHLTISGLNKMAAIAWEHIKDLG
jgi:hypothetical protein